VNHVLEAVARERSELTARLQALDEIERLCRMFDEQPLGDDARAGEIPPPSPPPRPKLDRVPLLPIKAPLPPPRRTQAEAPRRSPTPPSELANRRAKLMAIIGELEPVAFADLLPRIDGGRGQLHSDLQALRERRVIQSTGFSRTARWHLTTTLDRQTAEKHGKDAPNMSPRCRSDILSTIRSDPGEWSEKRITETGAWDREDVAAACGYLLDAGEIVLDPDGTYSPASLAEAA